MQVVALNRLRWNCRRGLLENDLVLEKFLVSHAETLDDEHLAALNKLLELDDNSLWSLLSGRTEYPAGSGSAISEILALLRAC